jgi:uncharacterized protein (DUF2147 family)
MTQKTLSIFRRVGLLAPAVLSALAVASAAAKAQQPSPTLLEAGVWMNDLGDGAVEIYICQDKASRLCGRIVWLKEPLNAQGVPKHDRYNPKAEMQDRPICGLPVLGNLARVSDGFDSGWIYDPKAGKSYDAAIRLAQRDQLVVTGYLGMKFMGKSFTWTRAPANLPRCDGTPAAQPINNGAGKPAVTQPGSAAAAPPKAKPAASTTATASTGSAATKPAATTTGKTTAAKTTTAAPGSTAKSATAKATTAKATATTAKSTTAKPTTTTKATTADAVPKPKPAQKPANAVANSASAPPAQQPAATSSAPKTIEADSATSWSN